MDCSKCKWAGAETCRICKAEQQELVAEHRVEQQAYGAVLAFREARHPEALSVLIVDMGDLEPLTVGREEYDLERN